MEELRQLRRLLAQVFAQPADGEGWLHSPSRLLRGRTPTSFLRQGRVVAVRDALAILETGAFLSNWLSRRIFSRWRSSSASTLWPT